MVPLRAESWIWYAIATTVLLARVISRGVHLGSIRRLQTDDWLMLVVLAFYTLELVALNQVNRRDSNLLPPGYLDTHTLDPPARHALSIGSRWVVVVEQCQCVSIWLVKACLLLMYARLTRHVYERQHLLVQLLFGYVVATFVVMELLYFFCWCRPFRLYWAVPTPNVQCSAATNHLITNAVFNLSSDVAMLCIALPMFLRSRLPLQRKVVLCAIFGLGVFVILCAVLSKYYSFSQPYGSEWQNWYVREASTAVLVANLPFTWGLVRRLFALGDDDGAAAGREHAGADPRAPAPAHQPRNGSGPADPAYAAWSERASSSRAMLALQGVGKHKPARSSSESLARFGNDSVSLEQYTTKTRPSTGGTTGHSLDGIHAPSHPPPPSTAPI